MASPLFRRFAMLLMVAIAARAVTFGNPILHVDEEFYFVTARAMLDGLVPYVDLWDRKPIGLFLIYVPAAALGYPLGVWGYQLLALAAVVGTALCIARLADRAGWQRGATLAGVAYILFLGFADGQGGQAPIFYNLPMAIAALLIAPGPHDSDAAARWRRGLGAMALVGLALQIKYSAVFEGAFFGLWWLWRDWRLGGSLTRALLRAIPLALAAFVPTLAAWGWYVAHGAGDAFVFANFTSILSRGSDPRHEQLRNIKWMSAMLGPLLILAILSRRETPASRFVGAWTIAALTAVVVFGSWFNHYALPVMAPAAAAAAGWIGAHRRVSIALLCVAFVTGQALMYKKRLSRGSPAQFAELTRAVGHGPESLYLYSGSPMIYASTGRPWLTRYIFPTHLQFQRERGAVGVDQQAEVERIFALRPGVVVMTAFHKGERPEMRALANAAVAARYRRTANVQLGRDRVAVYRLMPAAR
ncbi:MAG: hypothetical protein V4537_17835 [Pseudomonadota bacterium]